MSLLRFVKKQDTTQDPFLDDILSYVDALYSVAKRMTRNVSDAEDLVQDTMLKAVKSRRQYEADTNLRAWLFKILTNSFISRFHRGRLERNVLDGSDASTLYGGWMSTASVRSMCDAEGQAFRPIVERELSDALARLPDEYRIAVILSDVEEFSYREIAEIMGCPVGTVMSRLHRGRHMLQVALRDYAVSIGLVSESPAADSADEGNGEPRTVDIREFRCRKMVGGGG